MVLLVGIIVTQIITEQMIVDWENSSVCQYISDLDTFFQGKHVSQAIGSFILLCAVWTLCSCSPPSASTEKLGFILLQAIPFLGFTLAYVVVKVNDVKEQHSDGCITTNTSYPITQNSCTWLFLETFCSMIKYITLTWVVHVNSYFTGSIMPSGSGCGSQFVAGFVCLSFAALAVWHLARLVYEHHCPRTPGILGLLIMKELLLVSYFDRAWHLFCHALKPKCGFGERE